MTADLELSCLGDFSQISLAQIPPDQRRVYALPELNESVDSHVRSRLRQWLRRKHKIKGRVENQFPDDYLYQQLGVIRLTHYQRNLPWAKAK